MGEFIKHPKTGVEIKIATMDHCFYSREQLLKWKSEGYKGFYAREFDSEAGRRDTLERALSCSTMLYALPENCDFNPKVHTIRVRNNGFKHDDLIICKKGNRGSAYVYHDLPCKQRNNSVIWAVMIGERFDGQGRARTIFKCDCCGALFSVDSSEVAYLKARFPEWADWIKPNLKD